MRSDAHGRCWCGTPRARAMNNLVMAITWAAWIGCCYCAARALLGLLATLATHR